MSKDPKKKAKAGPFQEAEPQKTWFESHESEPVISAHGQSPAIRLRVGLTLYAFRRDHDKDTPVEKFVLVDLQHTDVTPGTVTFDRADKRGFYTEAVEVTMRFANAAGLEIAEDAPESSSEGGSISSSISFSVGAGFFGETATGSANWGISSSSTVELPDFEIVNDSDGTTVRHAANLRGGMVSGRYGIPTDLVIKGIRSELAELPAKARSNFPLVSKALFHAPQGLIEDRTLTIEITHRLMQVEKTVTPLGFMASVNRLKAYDATRRDQPQHVDWITLQIETRPWILTRQWNFTIPFSAV